MQDIEYGRQEKLWHRGLRTGYRRENPTSEIKNQKEDILEQPQFISARKYKISFIWRNMSVESSSDDDRNGLSLKNSNYHKHKSVEWFESRSTENTLARPLKEAKRKHHTLDRSQRYLLEHLHNKVKNHSIESAEKRGLFRGEIGIKSFNYYLIKEGLQSSTEPKTNNLGNTKSTTNYRKDPQLIKTVPPREIKFHQKSQWPGENSYEEIFTRERIVTKKEENTKSISRDTMDDCEICTQQRTKTLNYKVRPTTLEFQRDCEPGVLRESKVKRNIKKEKRSQQRPRNQPVLQFQSYNPNNPGIFKLETTPVAVITDFNVDNDQRRQHGPTLASSSSDSSPIRHTNSYRRNAHQEHNYKPRRQYFSEDNAKCYCDYSSSYFSSDFGGNTSGKDDVVSSTVVNSGQKVEETSFYDYPKKNPNRTINQQGNDFRRGRSNKKSSSMKEPLPKVDNDGEVSNNHYWNKNVINIPNEVAYNLSYGMIRRANRKDKESAQLPNEDSYYEEIKERVGSTPSDDHNLKPNFQVALSLRPSCNDPKPTGTKPKDLGKQNLNRKGFEAMSPVYASPKRIGAEKSMVELAVLQKPETEAFPFVSVSSTEDSTKLKYNGKPVDVLLQQTKSKVSYWKYLS